MKQGFSPRALRVSEQVQRELAQMLTFEVKDPRVKGVTITQCEVTSDLSHALVRYVHHDGFAGQAEADAGFITSSARDGGAYTGFALVKSTVALPEQVLFADGTKSPVTLQMPQ